MLITSPEAPIDATYITQTPNGVLTSEQAIGSLSSGIMRVTTVTGQITTVADPLPIANGGTNNSSHSTNGVMYFDGSKMANNSSFVVSPTTRVITNTLDSGTTSQAHYFNSNEGTYVINMFVINDGTNTSAPGNPAGSAAFVVRCTETSGSRPLFFGYCNSGGSTWNGWLSCGAVDSFASMALIMGDGSNVRTALHYVSSSLFRIGGGNGSNQFTTVAFRNTGSVALNNTDTANALFDLGGSTTSRASLRIASGAAPSSPGEGDIWNDSTSKSLVANMDGLKQAYTGVFLTQTATVTVANTTTETTLVSTVKGTDTLPANFLTAGKTVKFQAWGYFSTDSGAGPSLRIKIKYGSTVILDTGALNTTKTLTNQQWRLEGISTCYTTGASGTVWSQGTFWHAGSATTFNFMPMINSATVTIDTTATIKTDITAQWGTALATNTITLTNYIAEILNNLT